MELLNIQRGCAARWLHRARLSFGFVGITLTFTAINAAQVQVDEYAVKAAFLYKFGLFVEWPDSAFTSPTSPVNLCIVGADAFGKSLDAIVTGQQINGREVVIRRLNKVERNPPCHILYAGGSEEQSEVEIIAAVRGSPVLTVSDGLNSSLSIINFVIADNRVRFNIDEEEAAQNELLISSQLMKLALNVKRRSKEG
jgi:hypothetical protein